MPPHIKQLAADLEGLKVEHLHLRQDARKQLMSNIAKFFDVQRIGGGAISTEAQVTEMIAKAS